MVKSCGYGVIGRRAGFGSRYDSVFISGFIVLILGLLGNLTEVSFEKV